MSAAACPCSFVVPGGAMARRQGEAHQRALARAERRLGEALELQRRRRGSGRVGQAQVELQGLDACALAAVAQHAASKPLDWIRGLRSRQALAAAPELRQCGALRSSVQPCSRLV